MGRGQGQTMQAVAGPRRSDPAGREEYLPGMTLEETLLSGDIADLSAVEIVGHPPRNGRTPASIGSGGDDARRRAAAVASGPVAPFKDP